MTSSSPSSKQSLERTENGQPRFHGCSRIQEYEFLGKLGEGTFGEVSKARSKKTGAIVALKKILMHNEKDGFPITALREIKLLSSWTTSTYSNSRKWLWSGLRIAGKS